ncbi:MAG TPA: DUF6232 family protein [Rhizomicrobium sp.]|jgi:hypothetical protein|nr:DUF6232 family protein [Rhizomicrobium sp.]
MPADSAPSFSNEFGSVYSDRIAFNAKKGWFSGGISEELPIRHITSVRLEMTRKAVLGVILILIGIGLLYQGSGGAIVAGVFLLVVGVLQLIGWPKVTVNTSGNDLRTSTGGIWQKANAEAFVSAVRKALFDKP